MKWEDFGSKRVALLGAGRENLSLVPHLTRAGATVFICERDPENISEEFKYHFPEVKLVTGSNHFCDLDKYDYVFRSPGIPVAAVEGALASVKSRPTVTSATDLFLAMSTAKVIGVTGTKGKGTTSTMIGDILLAAGKKVIVAGNIGKPIFTVWEKLTPDTFVVLELSSFQLEDIHHSPKAAVVLPITEDHLSPLSLSSPNFHASMNDYVAAKAHITLHQTEEDFLVFAADNPESTAIANVAKSKKIAVSQSAYESHWNVDAKGKVYRQGELFTDLTELKLRGQHVFLNATIAIATVTEFGISLDAIKKGLREFKPLPHRLEEVKVRYGVRYVNDSYATAPEATIAALTAFTEPVVLIAGGSSKGAEFKKLAESIKDSSVKALVLIGQEAPRIKQAVVNVAPELKIIDGGSSMASAVSQAQKLAKTGDIILLSPACASKDMFRDAADRGEQFKRAIHS